jgi:hypothetical protein
MSRRARRNEGAAMVMVVMAVGLISTLSLGLLLTSASDVRAAAYFREQRTGFYAADAMLERALLDIEAVADWTALGDGIVPSTFVDGSADGTRTVDGTTIDLRAVVNMSDCQKTADCTDAELDAVTSTRPWGANNPRWQLYAYGAMRDLLPAIMVEPGWYVVSMVARDPLRSDRAIALRAEAFGPRHAHGVVEADVARLGSEPDYNDGVAIASWREVR